MNLVSASRTGGAAADTLIGVTDLELIASGDQTWLLALGRVPGVLMSFAVGPTGLSWLGQTLIPGTLSPLPALVSWLAPDASRLVVTGMAGTAYSWGWNAGSLSAPQTFVSLPEGLGRAATLDLPGGSFLWGNSIGSAGLTTWRRDAGGLVRTAELPDTGATYLDGITQLTATRAATGDVLLAVGGGDDGLTSFRVDPSGALAHAGSVGVLDGIGIDRPVALVEAGPVGSGRFVMAAQGSSSLTVIRVLADGKPVATDHVLDNLETRFANVTALASVTTAGHTYVVAGGSDGGLSLFELLPHDRLLHLRVLLDSAATTLDGVSALAASVSGGVLSIFAGSSREQGLTRLDLSLANLGPVIQGTAGDDTLTGTQRDDVIWGGIGHDLIEGGAGDDTLIDGPGRDTLTGGAGADTFVIMRDLAPDLITDFDPARDRIDLSSFRGFYSHGQLTITTTADGAEIVVQGERLTIRSADGLGLDASVFSRAVLFNLPRSPQPILAGLVIEGDTTSQLLQGSAVADFISGNDGEDTLRGGLGPDTLRGGAGNDVLWGDQENDSLLGGAGNDFISGGAGYDYLWGAEGDDTLLGEDDALGPGGHDQLFGAPGNDLLCGFGGDDRLSGGLGADTIWGGDGNDACYGDDGDDLVMGEAGDDTVVGGHGRDTLWGGPGNDKLSGETGDDLMSGEDGDDALWGGDGNDTMEGGAGNDTIVGNVGDDQIRGGTGNDILSGEDGADLIWGGDGDDRLWGGAGNDTMSGDAGHDTLWGGAGADVFVFAPASGADVIGDFDPARAGEAIDLTAFAGLRGFADLALFILPDGGDTLIALDPLTTLRLAGLSRAMLGADDFLFAG